MFETIQQKLSTYTPQPISQRTRYAVLLPLIVVNNEYHILYEVRAAHISQPGEVSFPGGRIEDNETKQEAAIRETSEELQISPDAIKLLGEIDFMLNGNRTIYCFVGVLENITLESIMPNQEVAEIFTVPLSYFNEHTPTYYKLQANVTTISHLPLERIPNRDRYTFKHLYHTIPFYNAYQPHTIWGITAWFTDRFIQILND